MMGRRVKTTDPDNMLSTTNGGEGTTSVNGATISETESTDAASMRDVDEIFVAVLRVFASRGRAIREERAKLEAARLLDTNAPNVPGDQEAGSTDQDTSEDIPNP